MSGHSEGSVKAIYYALAANAGIAFLKGAAVLWTGSGAMFAEILHSLSVTKCMCEYFFLVIAGNISVLNAMERDFIKAP